jgi:hypothetical protein
VKLFKKDSFHASEFFKNKSRLNRKFVNFLRSQVRASTYDPNKSTNKLQQFHKFIT